MMAKAAGNIELAKKYLRMAKVIVAVIVIIALCIVVFVQVLGLCYCVHVCYSERMSRFLMVH